MLLMLVLAYADAPRYHAGYSAEHEDPSHHVEVSRFYE